MQAMYLGQPLSYDGLYAFVTDGIMGTLLGVPDRFGACSPLEGFVGVAHLHGLPYGAKESPTEAGQSIPARRLSPPWSRLWPPP